MVIRTRNETEKLLMSFLNKHQIPAYFSTTKELGVFTINIVVKKEVSNGK